MQNKKKEIEYTENNKIVLDSELLTKQLVEKLWRKGIINWETYKNCIKELNR